MGEEAVATPTQCLLGSVDEAAEKYITKVPSACKEVSVCGGLEKSKARAYYLDDIWCPDSSGAPGWNGWKRVLACYGPGIEVGGCGERDVLLAIVGSEGIVSPSRVDEAWIGEIGSYDRAVGV